MSFTADDLRDRLKRMREAMGLAELARRIGVSTSLVNDVIHSKREPAGKILEFLRMKRVVTYARVRASK